MLQTHPRFLLLLTGLASALISAGCPLGDGAGGGDGSSCPQLPGLEQTASCTESQDCELAQICEQGRCQTMAACTDDCHCPADRSCDLELGRCQYASGQICGPCDQFCTDQGGLCVQTSDASYCSEACDPSLGPFCPAGYLCEQGRCVQDWVGTCFGCNGDTDCPAGEICNPNSRRCQLRKEGPQLELAFDKIHFYWEDTDPALSGPTANLQLLTAIGATGGQNFYAIDVPVGECQRFQSTLEYNAPYPIGDALDLGDAITLSSASTSWDFAARRNSPNPARNPSYSFPSGMTVDDWLAGVAHTWSATGGPEVGAFSAAQTFPGEFTPDPPLVVAQPVTARQGQDLTLSWSPTSSAPDTSMLGVVSYNIINGAVVEALVQIVCRVEDSAGSVTLPGDLLTDVPTGSYLNLYLQRAAVSEVTAEGLERGRISASLIRMGYVIFSI